MHGRLRRQCGRQRRIRSRSIVPRNHPGMVEPISISEIALEIVGDGAIAVRDLRRASGPTVRSDLPGTVGTGGKLATVNHDRETVPHTPRSLFPRGPGHLM